MEFIERMHWMRLRGRIGARIGMARVGPYDQAGSSEPRPTQPVKILQAIPTLNPSAGGPVEGLIQQGVVMRTLGHDVRTICLDLPSSPIDPRLPANSVYMLGPSHFKYAFASKLAPWFQEHAKEFDVIVVHGMWTYHGLCVAKAARALNVPYVMFLHGMLDPWFADRYPMKHAKKWLYWPWAEYRTIRDAALVLFTTQEEMRLARRSFWLYKVRERLVGYGIARRPPASEAAKHAFLQRHPEIAGKRCFLYLSRLHPKKGCDMLIRAFARAGADDPRLHLVLAGPGEGNYVAGLKALIADLGIESRVTFTGMVTGDLKWAAYDCAEVFVLPSHQENFGIVVAEALASSLPVLTTYQVNIWKEIEEAGGGIIQPDTQAGTDNLFQAWLTMTDPERDAMRQRALQCYTKNFDVENVTGNLVQALHDAIQERRRPFTFQGSFFESRRKDEDGISRGT